jgi:CRISPR-associated protein Cmr3
MYLSITPHDPIIARDGRPFGIGQGIRMRSLDWPYPSVLAGSLRTILGKLKGGFSEDAVTKLLEINIAGPLPMKGTEMFLPMPKDIIARVENRNLAAIPLRPVILGDGEGCDFPISGLLPAMIPESIDEDFKPKKLPAFWSMKKMIEWLSNPTGFNFVLCKDSKKEYDETNPCDDKKKNELWHDDPDFLESPERDERVHTGIDAKTGAAAVETGLLFMSAGLDLSTTESGGSIHLAAKIETDNAFEEIIDKLKEIHPLGGERRLAQWSRIDESIGWNCPEKISSKLAELNSGKIRMVLATPAIFSNGWLPGWLHLRTQEDGKEILEGIPPGATDDQKLKLVSACVDRWKPISGWSAEAKSRGPKAIRRMVPAGSVYFFEAQNRHEASSLAKSRWLESVCDKTQDCRDGFGLAVWGVWEETEKEDNKDKR